MATLVNTNRDAVAFEGWERDIVWLQSDLDATGAGVLEQVVDAIGVYYSISLIGTPTAAGTTFACHGPDTVPAELEAALDVIGAQTLSVVTLGGVTFS
jgi:hypothetical protein